ncbi:MAG TPA: LysR substrate-binding domain-containing protein [Candidatus Competibacteraceae bacterium]|nr:LysR family transcriptional regulator [Candidatus Competibacteraceae bacterium]MCP5134985.1 LysR family transcriptional regulator [Gammaproteobacteria bacterium]HPF59928.1 LysR substrate-binding domain-containing protein [Candidatus Competibacteraceae bacterium]HRY19477.1 LysR substrate-binding domain-containing protein [Candidatus Competibacteraceae bacterium]
MAAQLDPDLLRTFIAIVDAGGFTSAAQRVHRTQSAVSMQVRRLEAILDRALFQREGRGAQLTPDGEALLGYARRLLKLHDEALAVLTRPDLSGLLRLGTPDDYVGRFLPDILVRFARAFPRVQVEVHCEPSVNLRGLLAADRLDLALITCTPGAETGEVLRREPTVWATAERHLAHEDEPLPLALFQPGCPFRDWALTGLSGLNRPYRIAYTSASISGILAAVTAGLAVTVLGRSILPSGVRALRTEEGFPPLPPASITLHRGSSVSAVAECLAGYMREGFATEVLPPSMPVMSPAVMA